MGLLLLGSGGYESTEPGDPYLSRLPENYSNVSIHPFVRTNFLGRYLNSCNTIDNHNRMRMSDLEPNKYWVNQTGYFILVNTVVFGMGITDGKILFCHRIIEDNEDKKVTMRE